MLQNDLTPDPIIFNQTVQNVLSGNQPNSKDLEALIKFSKRNDILAWVQPIFESDTLESAKFLILKFARDFISSSWLQINSEERIEIRNNIFSLILQHISVEHSERTINMGNQVIVAILKYDWFDRWPEFIPFLLEQMAISPQVAFCCLDILTMFGEDISSYNSGLSKSRINELKALISAHFPPIFEIIPSFFSQMDNFETDQLLQHLIQESLKFLRIYNSFISDPTLFTQEFLEFLTHLLPISQLTLDVIGLFGEIISSVWFAQKIQQNSIVDLLVNNSLSALTNLFGDPPNFEECNQSDLTIIAKSLQQFFTFFPLAILSDSEESWGSIIIRWFLLILEHGKEESFRIAVEFWYFISNQCSKSSSLTSNSLLLECFHSVRFILVHKIPWPFEVEELEDQQPINETIPLFDNNINSNNQNLNNNQNVNINQNINNNQNINFNIKQENLSKGKKVIISEEIQAFREENDEFPVKIITECESALIWKEIRETFKYLTKINPDDMGQALIQFFDAITIENFNNLSCEMIESICFSLAASNGFSFEAENELFTNADTVFKPLCDNLTFSNPDTIPLERSIAIGYIIMNLHHYSFLNQNWPILKDLIRFILKCMTLPDSIIQAIASDAIAVIFMKCSISFIKIQPDETVPFFQPLLEEIGTLLQTNSLSKPCILSIFHGLSFIIQNDEMTNIICQPLEAQWNSLPPNSPENLFNLNFILKCFSAVLNNLSIRFLNSFIPIFQRISQNLIELNNVITQLVQSSQLEIHHFHSIKTQILRFFDIFAQKVLKIINQQIKSKIPIIGFPVQKAPEKAPEKEKESENIIYASLLNQIGAFFEDYTMPIEYRNPLLLSLFGHSLHLLKVTPELILTHIFYPTVELIKDDFNSYLEFRHPLGEFLFYFANSSKDFDQIKEKDLKSMFDVAKFLTSHPYIEINEIGLNALNAIVTAIKGKQAKYIQDSQIIELVIFIFNLLQNPLYLPTFNLQVKLLQNLFKANIAWPEVPDLVTSIIEFAPDERMVQQLLMNLSENANSDDSFHSILKDFVVEVKKYNPDDPALQKPKPSLISF